MEIDDTTAEGIYSSIVGIHKRDPALNQYQFNNFTESGMKLPAVIDNLGEAGITS